MGRHALLSASSSHRWLACPPSARLCENYEDTGSEYAQQGTDAHSLCEHKLKLSLGMGTEDPTEGLSFYDEEMEECACGYAEYVLSLAKYDFEMPATLEDDEIAAILVKADELAAWAADVKEFALQQALSGVKYAGFKVVAGRSNRKYTDEDAVADTVKKAGFDPYEPKLLGITAMEKLLGKKKFAEILKGLVEKPQGKPALVPESDKRPPMNTAQEDFKEN